MSSAVMWAAWPEWWGNRYEVLLSVARWLREEGHHEAPIATAQTACEVCAETTLSALFRTKDITYLSDPVGNLISTYSLANDRVRKLYEAVSEDPIHEEPFWGPSSSTLSGATRSCMTDGRPHRGSRKSR